MIDQNELNNFINNLMLLTCEDFTNESKNYMDVLDDAPALLCCGQKLLDIHTYLQGVQQMTQEITSNPKFEIGQTYKTRGKAPKICTVTDILKTYNSKGDLVNIRYVSTHKFLGQTVKNYDVLETTIAMGVI